MSDELREVLFKVYKEGFESALAKSDKHDFDVVEEALEKILTEIRKRIRR